MARTGVMLYEDERVVSIAWSGVSPWVSSVSSTLEDAALMTCDDDVNDMDGIGGPDGRPTNPGAVEQPDWRDNDCDGVVDEGTENYDDDGDGYTEVGGDCDDNDPGISPAFGNCP